MAAKYTYVSPGVINVTDETGAITELRFTSTGQIQSIKDPLDRVTQFTYDTNDYLNQITAPGNTVYKFTYDAQGRLLNQIDPLNQTVSFTYGANANTVLSVTDQKGRLMQYGYDANGNLTRITYPDSSFETFTYDASSRLTEARERSGDLFKYSYDTAGRLTRKTFDDNTYEEYTYDSKGNLTSVRDTRGGMTALVYDTSDRLTKITYPNGRFLEYTYDSEGRRTRMVDQSGFTVNYSYDLAGRLDGLTDGADKQIIAYEYDVAGRLAKETNGNGTYTTYSYDKAGQLLKITNFKADNTINSAFEYTYDSLGRQTTAKTLDGTWSYTYDATGQLTGANLISTNPSIPNQTLSYSYDSAGNRTRIVVNGVTTNYASNTLNQYTTVGTVTHTYDADGNLISIVDGTKTWTYTYNDENRLIRVVAPEGTWDYEYDPFGNRTASIFNGQRTEYLVDPFGLGNVVGEYGSNGLIADYVHGIGLVGRFNSSNAAYYDSDYIGSTIGLTNSSGSYVDRYAYRPFGENLLTAEGVANPFEYVGQWGVMDETNGLDFMRARYYSAQRGRFNSEDPIGQLGGINLYTYAKNSPTNGIDPSGLWVFSIGTSVTAGGGAGGAVGVSAVWDGSSLLPRIQVTVGGGGYGGIGGSVDWTVFYSPNAQNADQLRGLGKQAGVSVGGGIVGGISGIFGTGYEGVQASLGLGLKGSLGPVSFPGFATYTWDITSWVANATNGGIRTLSQYSNQAARATTRALFDPLVLDLDGDGVELISITDSTALFDLNADGFREQTGWVKADDGILVLDINGDGRINNINELFGNATTDGFIILKQLDSNNDNVINASDTKFTDLRIWQDLNQDGISDLGELKTLVQVNVSSISLTTTQTNFNNQGNLIRNTGKYTLTNGVQRDVVSLLFAADRLNTRYDKPYQLKSETLFLPTARGYGGLPDLYIAMSLDPQLLSLVREFVALKLENLDQVYGKVEDILFRWARVDTIAPDSRGPFFDARKITFLETFLQQDLPSNFTSTQRTLFLRQAWDTVTRAVSGRLIAQSILKDSLPFSAYDLNSDSLGFDNSNILVALFASDFTVDALIDTAQQNVSSDPISQARYWSYALGALDAHETNFNIKDQSIFSGGVTYETLIKDVLQPLGLSNYLDALYHPIFGRTGNDTLYGSEGIAGFLDGLAGNDTLTGSVRNDLISGGAGDDLLAGGAGEDWLLGGSGNDFLDGGFGYDRLDGGMGIDTASYDFYGSGVEVRLDNGTVAFLGEMGDRTEMLIDIENIIGGTGNDLIFGNALDNSLHGNNGDDYLFGGDGNDFLDGGFGGDILDGGVGNDTISYGFYDKGIDARLDLGMVTFPSEFNNNVDILLNIENLVGSHGRDRIIGNAVDNILIGNADDDFLFGGDGNDILFGSQGNDLLTGGNGSDEFTFATGSAFTIAAMGRDRITDFLSGTDRIVLSKDTFTALTSPTGGALNANEFAVINESINGATVAGASIARIVFNQFNGDLFYNFNSATAGLGSGGRFASLAGTTSLSATDFLLHA